MKNFWQNRPDNERINADTLAGIPDDQLPWVLFDFIWYKVGDDYRRTPDVLAELPVGFQVIYHLFVLDGEIGNGGFNQYFFNGLNRSAKQQREALKMIEADDYQKIFSEAFKIFENEKKNAELQNLYDDRTIESFFSTYDITELGRCDEDWYALDKKLDSLLVRFIRSHPELFFVQT